MKMDPLNLLYIEDDIAQHEAFLDEASRRGVQTTLAASGAEGLKLLDPASIDLVLCDLNMPGMNGLEVLRKMREIAPDIPFIVATAHGSIPLAVEAIRQGGDDFILKPFDYDILENALRKAVETRKLRKDLADSQHDLRILTENIPDIVYSFDEKGIFLKLSASAENVLGYKPEEKIGTSVMDIIHPDDRQRILDGMRAIEEKRSDEVRTVEFRMLTKSGEVKHFEVNRKAVFIDGQYVRNEGIARDITERKKLQQELEKHTQKLEELVKERTGQLENAYSQLLALHQASAFFSRMTDEEELIKEVPRLLTGSLNFDRAFIMFSETGKLALRAWQFENDPPEVMARMLERFSSENLVIPKVIQNAFDSKETIFVDNLDDQLDWPKDLQKVSGAKSLVVSALQVHGEAAGVIVASLTIQDRSVTQQEIARFEMFVHMVGLALERIRFHQNLEKKIEERTRSLKEANRELVQYKTQFDAVLDSAPNMMIIADSENRVISINRMIEEVFSLQGSEFYGQPVETLVQKIKTSFEDPDYFEHRFFHTSLKEHRDEIMDLPRMSARMLPPREMQISPMQLPIIGKDGMPLGRFWTLVDVTEFGKTTELLRKVVEASPIPFIVSRLEDGRVIFANEPLAQLMGTAPDDVVGKMTPDFYADPEDRLEVVRRLQQDGYIKDFEVRIRKANGDILWMMFNLITTELAGEMVVMGGLYDIHERKIAEEALRESEERFRQLTETINEVFWMIDPVKHEMLYISPKFKDIVGLDPVKVQENIESMVQVIHPEDRERIVAAMSKQITGEYDEEYRIVRPDGAVRWVREKAFPITNEQGELHRICGVSEDFTERKEAEEALRWERNFVSAVLDTAGALVVVMDREGRIIRFNKACEKMSGYTFEEVKGRPFYDFLIVKEEMERVKDRFKNILAGHFPNEGENYWVARNGEKRLIAWSNTALTRGENEIEYIVAIGIDITETREAEEELKLYKKVFMSTSDGIALIAQDGTVMARNPAHRKYTGYSDEEMLGKPIKDFMGGRTSAEILAAVKQTGSFRGEIVATSKEGIQRHMDMSIFPIVSEEGKSSFYVGMGRDITERKIAQEAVATRLRYEEGLANCSQALLEQDTIEEDIEQALETLLIAADVDRVNFFENFDDPTFGLCTRLKHEVVAEGIKSKLGDPLLSNLPYRSGFEHWAELMREGKPYYGITSQMPEAERMILSDQEILSIIAIPLFVNGRWYGFIGFDEVHREREWTEEEIRLLRTASEMIGGYLSRRQAEEALRVSEERFRTLVENANDIIYSLNPEGEFTYLSPQFEDSTGFKIQDWIGRKNLDLIYKPDVETYNRWLAQAECSVEEHQDGYEFRILDDHGHLRWFVTSASIVKDGEGNILEITGVAHDITALRIALDDLAEANNNLKETQTQLIQSEKMASLGMLVAGIAHEINTPIGAVNSMHNTLVRAIEKVKARLQQMCTEDELKQPELAKNMEIIEEANRIIESGTQRVTNIVRRLRSFARLDQAELQEVDIHEGLDDTLTLAHHELKHKVTINRDYGTLPRIRCYPGRLNQVFMNLLINANQAIEDKGEITVTTRKKGDRVVVSIADTGQGIPEANLSRIFDPGFTTKGVGVGTGLGLSICYQIIQDHRGEIKVTSEVGKGTTFTISLPLKLTK